MFSTGVIRLTLNRTKTNVPSNLFAGRKSYSSQRKQNEDEDENLTKIEAYYYTQRSEPNPEYHHAPRCYVKNYIKHQSELRGINSGNGDKVLRSVRYRNPRYRWADFRRRMVYGIYDI